MIDRVRELTREIDLERLEAVLNALRRAIEEDGRGDA